MGPLEYSTASLCLAHSTKFVYVKQAKSVDEPFICALLERHRLGLEMAQASYESGEWLTCLKNMERSLQLEDEQPVYR